MQIPSLPQIAAPLATGHPLGLPGAPKPLYATQRVIAAGETAKSETGRWAGKPPQQGTPDPRLRSGPTGGPDEKPHVAPPSIMQIKISQMLHAQADEAKHPEPEQATEETPTPTVGVNTEPENRALPKDADTDAPAAAEARGATAASASASVERNVQEPEGQPQSGYELSDSLSRNTVLSTLP